MLEDIVRMTRSCRRFHQDESVSLATLRELADRARLASSSMNLQPLKYILCCAPDTNAAIFPLLAWAGYLKEWPGPLEGERPAAYIVVLGDTTIGRSFGVDEGLALANILLSATERGLGGCIVASVDRDGLRRLLAIPERCEILHVLALGTPKETVVVEPMGPDGDVRYWRDARGTHHVPKRLLAEIVVAELGA